MADIILRLKVDDREFEAKIENADEVVRRLRGSTDTVTDSMSKWGMIVTGYNQALEVINKVVSVISKPINVAAQFEAYETQLKVMLGSADAAQNRLEELVDFAANTPFELPEVVEAGNKLQTLGRYSQDTLRDLGDLASAANKPFEQVLSAFSKLASGQKGIAIDMFRDLLITTDDWVKATNGKMGKNGELQVSVEEMISALPKIIKEKGFDGMMAEQAKITKGMESNFQDMITQQLQGLGERLLPAYKETIQVVGHVIGAFSGLVSMTLDFVGATKKETDALRTEQIEFNALINLLQDETIEKDARKKLIDEIQTKYPAYLKNLDLEKASIEEIQKVQSSANLEFEKSIRLKMRKDELETAIKNVVYLEDRLALSRKELAMRIAAGTEQQKVPGSTTTVETALKDQAKIIQDRLDAARKIQQEIQAKANSEGLVPDPIVPGKPTTTPVTSASKISELELLKMRFDLNELSLVQYKESLQKRIAALKSNTAEEKKILLSWKKELISVENDFAQPVIPIEGEMIDVVLDDSPWLELEKLKVDAMSEGFDKQAAMIEAWYAENRETDLYQQSVEGKIAIDQIYLNKKMQLKRSEFDNEVQHANQTLTLVRSTFAEHTAIAKLAAVAQAIINTYQGAAAALAPPPLGAGPIFGPVLAALTIVSGMAQVANIQKTAIPGYAQGGGILWGENKTPEIIAPAESYADMTRFLVAKTIVAVESQLKQAYTQQAAQNSGSGSENSINEMRNFIKEVRQWQREITFKIRGNDLETARQRIADFEERLSF